MSDASNRECTRRCGWGDQIKLGESSRAYVLDGDESLMPEEGLSAAEMKALAALNARRRRRRNSSSKN